MNDEHPEQEAFNGFSLLCQTKQEVNVALLAMLQSSWMKCLKLVRHG